MYGNQSQKEWITAVSHGQKLAKYQQYYYVIVHILEGLEYYTYPIATIEKEDAN